MTMGNSGFISTLDIISNSLELLADGNFPMACDNGWAACARMHWGYDQCSRPRKSIGRWVAELQE